MHIPPPADLTDVLWEGPLEAPGQTLGLRGDEDTLVASIGQPSQWPDGQLLGQQWQPPAGGGRYHLVRLAFSLRPTNRAMVTAADFCVRLEWHAGQAPIVYDAFPMEQTVAQDRRVTLGLGPTFKLGPVDAQLGKVETTIDMGRIIPVVVGSGLAEPSFCWRYTAHPRYPLTGSRLMVALVHLPQDLPWAAATLELTATVETRFGPIRVAAPETASQRLRFVVGQ